MVHHREIDTLQVRCVNFVVHVFLHVNTWKNAIINGMLGHLCRSINLYHGCRLGREERC